MDYLAHKELMSYSSIYYTPNSELYHHGVKGQKHGVRNALWYPIEAWKASLGRKPKAQAKAERDQVSNQQALGQLQNIVEQRPVDPIEAAKKSILDSGDLTQVYKNQHLFTTQEIASAISRYNQITLLEKAMAEQKGMKKLELMKKVDSYANAMGTASKAFDNTIKFINTIDKMSDAYTGYKNTKEKGGYLKVSKDKLNGMTNAEFAQKKDKDNPFTKDNINKMSSNKELIDALSEALKKKKED